MIWEKYILIDLWWEPLKNGNLFTLILTFLAILVILFRLISLSKNCFNKYYKSFFIFFVLTIVLNFFIGIPKINLDYFHYNYYKLSNDFSPIILNCLRNSIFWIYLLIYMLASHYLTNFILDIIKDFKENKKA